MLVRGKAGSLFPAVGTEIAPNSLESNGVGVSVGADAPGRVSAGADPQRSYPEHCLGGGSLARMSIAVLLVKGTIRNNLNVCTRRPDEEGELNCCGRIQTLQGGSCFHARNTAKLIKGKAQSKRQRKMC